MMSANHKINKRNRYVKLITDTGIFAIGNLLEKMVQLFLMPLYTSILTTSEYGVAELINNSAQLLGPISTLCIFEAVFRFAVDLDCNKNKLLSHALKIEFVGFFVLFLGAYIFQCFFHYEFTWYLVLITITSSLRTLFANYVRGIGKSKCFAVSGFITMLVLYISNILLLAYFKIGIRGYLISLAIAYSASTLFLILGSKVYRDFHFEKLDKKYLRILLVFSIPMILNNASWWTVNISSRYIVLWFCGINLAGIYSATTKLPSLINAATGIFQQAWKLTAARESTTEDRNDFFTKIFKAYSAFLMLIASLILCFVPFLTSMLLKNEFISGKVYLPLMLITAILNGYNVFFEIFYTAFKQNKMIMVSSLIGAAINLAGSILLVPHIGIWGAAVASNISYLTIAIIRMIDTRRLVKVKIDLKYLVPACIILVLQTFIMTVECPYYVVITIFLFVALVVISIVFYWNIIKTASLKFLNLLKSQ